MNKAFSLSFIVAIIVVSVYLLPIGPKFGNKVNSGKNVIQQWQLQKPSGEKLDFNSLKGKVIFLNIWATWCPPCVAEMPSIQKLYNKFKGQEVVFVCVSDEENETIAKFIKERKFTFPVYRTSKKSPKDFQTEGIPATFIISRAGKIVSQHIGSANWANPKVVELLEKLLAEKAQ